MENGKLWRKLLEIRKAVPYLKQDAEGFNYSYTSTTKVLTTLNEQLNKHGIMLKPEVVSHSTERVMKKKKLKSDGKVTYVDHYETLYILEMTMTWIDVETGEEDTNRWMSTGVNGDDLGFGSALTYGKRYFLMQFFNIPNDDKDPEQIQKDRYMEEKSRVDLSQRVEAQKEKDGLRATPVTRVEPTAPAEQAETPEIKVTNEPIDIPIVSTEGPVSIYTESELNAFPSWKELIPIIEKLGGKKDDLEGRISKGKCISYILALQSKSEDDAEINMEPIEKPKENPAPVPESTMSDEQKVALAELVGETDVITELANGSRSKEEATMIYRHFNSMGISQSVVCMYRDKLGLKATYPTVQNIYVNGTKEDLLTIIGLYRKDTV